MCFLFSEPKCGSCNECTPLLQFRTKPVYGYCPEENEHDRLRERTELGLSVMISGTDQVESYMGTFTHLVDWLLK